MLTVHPQGNVNGKAIHRRSWGNVSRRQSSRRHQRKSREITNDQRINPQGNMGVSVRTEEVEILHRVSENFNMLEQQRLVKANRIHPLGSVNVLR